MQHKEATFNGCNGLTLRYQYWLPRRNPENMLVLSHGVCEHSGFYPDLVNRFLAKDYFICGMDYPGHGKSEGPRGYIDDFSDYVNDLGTFIDLMRHDYPDLKPFLLGHSMGALVAATYTVKHQHNLSGLLLTSIGLRARYMDSLTLRIANQLAPFLPSRMAITYPVFANISRNRAVVKSFLDDPLVYKGKLYARWFAQILKANKELEHSLPEIQLPILIMHGTMDRLVNPQGSHLLYELVGSKDKTLKIYQGFGHSILNDSKCQVVQEDIESWLDAHTLVKSP